MAERELIIKKMDAQFESDLKMRKQTSECNKRAIDATKNLSLLQKEMRAYGGVVWDLTAQARNNAKMIEDILNRPDIKKLGFDE